jgi:squalene-hopene/tetraprenyl-beta-curcumene cyclase
VSYAGLKSMLYAGLDRNDPRVKAVVAYLRRNWTFDKNPGMPKSRDQQSLYFYYTVLSRALQAYGVDEIPAIDGATKHNWRAELVSALAGRQRKDGSWMNTAVRWGENNPVLVTGYEVLALEDALKK